MKMKILKYIIKNEKIDANVQCSEKSLGRVRWVGARRWTFGRNKKEKGTESGRDRNMMESISHDNIVIKIIIRYNHVGKYVRYVWDYCRAGCRCVNRPIKT